MRRHLPSLIALQCFESSSRHLSFTKAGDELCLTQSAVSRQIKNLESFIGQTLFERVNQRITLTATGKSYAQEVGSLLNRLEEVTKEVSLTENTTMRVLLEPSMASRWMIPRLAEFKKLHPNITVDICTELDQTATSSVNHDIAILYGDGHWKNNQAHFLMPDELVAVAIPELLKNSGPVSEYADIAQFTLLHHSAQLSASQEWLARSGLSSKAIQDLQGQRFEHFYLLLEAALQGLGVAILPLYFVKDELERGELTLACTQSLICEKSYYIAIPNEKRSLSCVKVFSDWLISQN